VSTIEYDPNRSARIALLTYADGEKRYILHPVGLDRGDDDRGRGQRRHPAGQLAAAEEHPARHAGAQRGAAARAAAARSRAAPGSGVQVVAKEGEYASVKMPSGEIRKINVECYATIGQVGNLDHENVSIGKAGRSRWLGQRPHVRGVAMNPVDHPLGGGEGKTSGGRHPVSPWGIPTKGYKTRNNKRTDRFIVTRRTK
jgi:large subunit ribosomal protein L2